MEDGCGGGRLCLVFKNCGIGTRYPLVDAAIVRISWRFEESYLDGHSYVKLWRTIVHSN